MASPSDSRTYHVVLPIIVKVTMPLEKGVYGAAAREARKVVEAAGFEVTPDATPFVSPGR